MSPAHLTQTNLPSTLDAVNAFTVSQWMHLPQPLRRNFWSLYPFALLGKDNLRLTLFFDFCFQNSLLILLPEHISSLNILWIDNMIFSFSFFSRAQWVKGIAYHRTSKILAKLLFLVVPKTVPLTSPWLRWGRQRPRGASKGCLLPVSRTTQAGEARNTSWARHCTILPAPCYAWREYQPCLWLEKQTRARFIHSSSCNHLSKFLQT